jgi:hypothetical protein
LAPTQMTAWLQAVTEGRTVTWLRRLDAGLSPLGLGFETGIVYLGFKDNVTVESTYAIPCQYHSTNTFIHLSPMPVFLVTDCVIQLDTSRKIRKVCAVATVAVCLKRMSRSSLAVRKETSKSCQNIRYCKRYSNLHPPCRSFTRRPTAAATNLHEADNLR